MLAAAAAAAGWPCSKHLKRGEFAAVRAAQQQAADIHTTQQRLMNEQASEITQQRHQETTSKLKALTTATIQWPTENTVAKATLSVWHGSR